MQPPVSGFVAWAGPIGNSACDRSAISALPRPRSRRRGGVGPERSGRARIFQCRPGFVANEARSGHCLCWIHSKFSMRSLSHSCALQQVSWFSSVGDASQAVTARSWADEASSSSEWAFFLAVMQHFAMVPQVFVRAGGPVPASEAPAASPAATTAAGQGKGHRLCVLGGAAGFKG